MVAPSTYSKFNPSELALVQSCEHPPTVVKEAREGLCRLQQQLQ